MSNNRKRFMTVNNGDDIINTDKIIRINKKKFDINVEKSELLKVVSETIEFATIYLTEEEHVFLKAELNHSQYDLNEKVEEAFEDFKKKLYFRYDI